MARLTHIVVQPREVVYLICIIGIYDPFGSSTAHDLLDTYILSWPETRGPIEDQLLGDMAQPLVQPDRLVLRTLMYKESASSIDQMLVLMCDGARGRPPDMLLI